MQLILGELFIDMKGFSLICKSKEEGRVLACTVYDDKAVKKGEIEISVEGGKVEPLTKQGEIQIKTFIIL